MQELGEICDAVLMKTEDWLETSHTQKKVYKKPYTEETLARVFQAAVDLTDRALFVRAFVVVFDSQHFPQLRLDSSSVAKLGWLDMLPM